MHELRRFEPSATESYTVALMGLVTNGPRDDGPDDRCADGRFDPRER